jgi:hypothetical protein
VEEARQYSAVNALPLSVLLALWTPLVAYCAWHLVKGVSAGRIKFIAGVLSPEFDRGKSPVGYWIAVVWDALLTTVVALPLILVAWSSLR